MPCHSAKFNSISKKYLPVSSTKTTRARTAYHHKNALEHGKNIKLLQEHCKRINKVKIDNFQSSEDIKFDDYLHVTGVAAHERAPTITSVKLKIHPALIPKQEIERIKQASRYLNIEERIEENNKREENAKRAKNESESRKQLLKKIDDEKQKLKEERNKLKDNKKELESDDDDDENEKIKVLDRVFMYKQEQEEEVRKANRIILNAKCSVVREAQMQEKNEIAKEIRKEEVKLENKMLETDKKYVEEDEKKADQVKQNKQIYAEDIKKQLELKESLRLLEVQRMQDEQRVQSKVFGKITLEDEIEKKIKKEKREKLREELDKVCETFKMFKQLEFEQDRSDEMKIRQYINQREERQRKIELERKITKEAVDQKKQKLFEIQQKLLLVKSNQEEVALRRDQENKEREFRKKEKEKIIKRKEFEKVFAKCRQDQIIEKKRHQALAVARNEEDFKNTVQKLKEEEAKMKEIEGQRSKLKIKYREEIIQQISQKQIDKREKERKAKNEFLAWKQKQNERDRNVRMVIDSKLKALKESNLPEKYIKDVEKQLQFALNST